MLQRQGKSLDATSASDAGARGNLSRGESVGSRTRRRTEACPPQAGQGTENRRTGDRGRRTEDRERRTEDGGQRTEAWPPQAGRRTGDRGRRRRGFSRGFGCEGRFFVSKAKCGAGGTGLLQCGSITSDGGAITSGGGGVTSLGGTIASDGGAAALGGGVIASDPSTAASGGGSAASDG